MTHSLQAVRFGEKHVTPVEVSSSSSGDLDEAVGKSSGEKLAD
jgi:hypothetical protein